MDTILSKENGGTVGCMATHRIADEGYPPRLMHRAEPNNELDSGWVFMSGVNEDDEYMDNAANWGIYTLNTIANYDPTIVEFLNAPIGSAFEKTPESDVWVQVDDYQPAE